MVTLNANVTTALRTLQLVNRDLDVTQQRLATGLKVASASDNPTVWAAAQGIRADIRENAGIREAMSSMGTQAKVATAGLEQTHKILGEMQAVLTKAKSADADGKAILQKDLAELQNQLKAVVSDANVNGSSWLDGSKATASVVTSLGASGTTSMSVSLTALTKAGENSGPATGILDKPGAVSGESVLAFNASTSDIDEALSDLATATSAVASSLATVGGSVARLKSHEEFLTKISDIMSKALGEMVNADMEEETAKLAALQTRQQLSAQLLAIANQSEQNILLLFR